MHKKILFLCLFLFLFIPFIQAQENVPKGENLNLEISGITLEGSGLKLENVGEKSVISFVGENPSLKIGEFSFENIKSEELSGHPTYLELDENGTIIMADFSVAKDSEYTLEGVSFLALEGTRILYDKETGLRFIESKKSPVIFDLKQKIKLGGNFRFIKSLTSYGSDMEFSGRITYVSKDEIQIPAGIKTKIGNNQFLSKNNKINIYFKKESEKKGNYAVIERDYFELKTEEKGDIDYDAIPGNKLFMMQKRDMLSGIFIPDERANLKIDVKEGAGLTVSSREKENKIPFVEFEKGGILKMENGRNHLRITSDGEGNPLIKIGGMDPLGTIINYDPKKFEDEQKYYQNYNGIPMEINENNKKFIIGSSNRFVFLDKGGKITYTNTLDLPPTNNFEENMIKSVYDLGKKFPKIEFTSFKYLGPGSKEPNKNADISADMAQLVYYWLKKNPDVNLYVNKLDFGSSRGASSSSREKGDVIISIGEEAIDLPTFEKRKIRALSNRLEILDHEFIHSKDQKRKFLESEKYSIRKPFQGIKKKYGEIVEDSFKELKKDRKFKKFSEEVKRFKKSLTDPEQKLIFKKSLGHYPKESFETEKFREDVLVISQMNNLFENVKSLSNGKRDLIVFSEKATLLKKKLEKILLEKYLLYPYVYQNYDGDYAEIPAVYNEIKSPKKIRSQINRGNDILRRLTQLAYDTDKLTKEQYLERMKGYCELNPDKCGKCIEYTLTCKK